MNAVNLNKIDNSKSDELNWTWTPNFSSNFKITAAQKCMRHSLWAILYTSKLEAIEWIVISVRNYCLYEAVYISKGDPNLAYEIDQHWYKLIMLVVV